MENLRVSGLTAYPQNDLVPLTGAGTWGWKRP